LSKIKTINIIEMKIATIKHLGNYQLEVVYENGNVKIIDLENFLKSSTHPLIQKYLDVELFSQVYLDKHGVPCWGDNEFDINPQSILNDEFTVTKSGNPFLDKLSERTYGQIKQKIIDRLLPEHKNDALYHLDNPKYLYAYLFFWCIEITKERSNLSVLEQHITVDELYEKTKWQNDNYDNIIITKDIIKEFFEAAFSTGSCSYYYNKPENIISYHFFMINRTNEL
jgi:hypothetical protein